MSANEYIEHCVEGEIARRVCVQPCHREFAAEYRRLYQQLCEASVGLAPQLTDEERGKLNGCADTLAGYYIDLIGA